MNRSTPIGSALAFVAGYVDTACFILLFGVFTAHVTGNFVLIGSELVHPMQGVTIKLLAFPAFVTAVAASRLIALAVERRGRAIARPLLLLQIALLAACMLCGLQARPLVDPEGPWVLAAGLLGAAAMGVQNASTRLAFDELSPTTMMTGNVTQLVFGLVDVLRGVKDAGPGDRVGKFAWPILAFAFGAISGALICQRVSLWALALPLLVLSGVALTPATRR